MKLKSVKCSLKGQVRIPASKSHTIRALIIATLADGESTLLNPLTSGDTKSCCKTCEALGAEIQYFDDRWIVKGTGGKLKKADGIIDVGNSGTTLYIALSAAALGKEIIEFTGDYQIQRRPATPLLNSLQDLGVEVVSVKGNGCAPITVRGPMRGGKTVIECPTSQYLSSLLLSCPLAKGDSEINVPLLNEKPYVEITLDWLTRQGIKFQNENFKKFEIPGKQSYTSFSREIPADFSSATFFLVAAAITNSDVTLRGLDMTDSQGDKAVVGMLRKMGVEIEISENFVRVCGGELTGAELDLNSTPDAISAMAVAGCFAKGETRLVNVPQAREKETDRIAVMCKELKKLGADIEELPAGLVIRESELKGGEVCGYDDHRVVMSMAVAGLRAENPVVVDSAEAMSITFPNFVELLNSLGADCEKL
jgi:3-phosphoshikimate 1-carboxyvinyltransferase